jgi:hypothetical protein
LEAAVNALPFAIAAQSLKFFSFRPTPVENPSTAIPSSFCTFHFAL